MNDNPYFSFTTCFELLKKAEKAMQDGFSSEEYKIIMKDARRNIDDDVCIDDNDDDDDDDRER